jgi:PAS domain S-box-containing protein
MRSTALPHRRDDKSVLWNCVLSDFTETHDVLTALEESEHTARALLDAPPDTAILLDPEGTILALNSVAARKLGRPESELLGTCVFDRFDEPVATRRRARVEEVARTGRPVQFEDERDGRCYDSHLYPVRNTQGVVTRIAVFAQDVTNTKVAQQQLARQQARLKALSATLARAEEAERKRIAQVLHDEVGQLLAIARIKLNEIRTEEHAEATRAAARDVDGLVDRAMEATRSLTSELSSPILAELGLRPALEHLARDFEQAHGLQVELAGTRALADLPSPLTGILFRAIRELLFNVAKHADAQHVNIRLTDEEDERTVVFEDDGVGFDVHALEAGVVDNGRFGLFSVRQQIEHAGGYMNIHSSSGRGTRVTIRLPLEVASADDTTTDRGTHSSLEGPEKGEGVS